MRPAYVVHKMFHNANASAKRVQQSIIAQVSQLSPMRLMRHT